MNGSKSITMVISECLEMNVPVLEWREVVVTSNSVGDRVVPCLTGGWGHQDAGRRLGLRLTAAAKLRLLHMQLPSLEVRQSSPGGHVGAAHSWPSLQYFRLENILVCCILYLYGLTGGQYEVRTGVGLESVEHLLPAWLSLSQPQHHPQVSLHPAGPEGEDDRGDDGVAVGGGDGEVVQPGWRGPVRGPHCTPEETEEVRSPGEADHHQYQHRHTGSSSLLSAATLNEKNTKFDTKRLKIKPESCIF